MKWILFIMLFVTPAKNLTSAEQHDTDPYRRKFESRRIWTLQTAASMEFSSAEMCAAMENNICQAIIDPKVATLTLRMWCVCDPPDKCPAASTLPKEITEPCGPQLKDIQRRIISPRGPSEPSKGNFTILPAFPPN